MRAQHHGELADLAGMNKVTAAHRHAPPARAAAPTPQPQPAATAAKVYPALPPLLDEAVAALVHASPAMLPGLVAQYGSPLHLVWPQRLEDNVRKLVAVLQSHPMPFEIFYGAKVNKSPALVRAAVQAGIGVDVSSLYEAGDALRAGADPTRLCATGPAKTRAFHKLLLDNASLISVDSLQELQDLDHCLQSAGAVQRARVLLRYRPQALATSRFGMGAGDLRAGLARLAKPEARMVLEGFHFHLSGYAVEPRVQAVRELLPWVHEARRMGLNARMLDIGGGLPIRYVDTAAYSAFLAAQDGAHYRSGKVPTSFYPYGGPVDACMWMEQLLCSACTEGMTVAQALNAAGLTLAIEPGRSLVDQAAISVFRATRVKPLADGRYVIFVEGSSFSACETWFGSEFLVDPVLVPGDGNGPRPATPQACHAYIAGHSCLDDDVLTHRWIGFARVPQAGDLLVYANTAGYQMARNMIVAAMRSGRLQPGGVVVESSSGNTGIGLAIAAIEFGLRFIAVVDHHAAPDKIAVMRALGAEIRYVEGDYREDEVAVVERQRLAAEVASKIPGAVFMNQSDNVANAGGYFDFVREVIDQVQGPVDAYVGCVGTGGSMTGIARGLKLHNPRTRTIAVEPAGSIIFGQPGRPYYQSGTGTPKGDTVGLVLDYSCIDLGVQVTDAQAFETARYFAQHTGLLVGGSTGGVLYKALEFIHSGMIAGNVVAVVADGGEKYLHTVFNEAWLKERNIIDPTVWAQLDGWLAKDVVEELPRTNDRLKVA